LVIDSKCFTGEKHRNLENARIELERLHLLQSENYDHYQLHQLIHDFLQVKLEKLSTVTQKEITLANFLFLDIGQLFSNLFNRQSLSTTLKRNFCQAMVDIAQEIPQQPIQKDIQRFKLAIPPFTGSSRLFTGYCE